ncbi:MAG: hypothetical protein ABIQ16_03980, partial [Polyangiaceae bacterium]
DAEEQASAAAAAIPPPAPPVRPVAFAAAAAPPPPAAHSTTHTAAVLTTGVGAALLLSGAVLYFRAHQRFSEAKASCPCREGSFSDWQNLTNLSYALLAVGGVGVAVGGTYWALSASRDGARGSTAFLGVDGRF